MWASPVSPCPKQLQIGHNVKQVMFFMLQAKWKCSLWWCDCTQASRGVQTTILKNGTRQLHPSVIMPLFNLLTHVTCRVLQFNLASPWPQLGLPEPLDKPCLRLLELRLTISSEVSGTGVNLWPSFPLSHQFTLVWF